METIMCGRFVSTSTPDDLTQFFDADPPDIELADRYNIAPTAPVYTIIDNNLSGREVQVMRWGLLPRWAKSQTGRPLFNARGETIATNNAFARSFQQRRCLIVADGFYEWTTNEDGTKQPHYIAHRDGDPLAFAGVWRTWRQPGTDTKLESCAIITCGPNQIMAPIHDRMPAILAPSTWPEWFSSGTTTDDAAEMLEPAPDELLTTHQVSPEANSAKNDKPELIEPVSRGA